MSILEPPCPSNLELGRNYLKVRIIVVTSGEAKSIAWTACRCNECGQERRNRGEEAADVHGVTDLSPPITVQSVMFDAAVVFYAATSKRCVQSHARLFAPLTQFRCATAVADATGHPLFIPHLWSINRAFLRVLLIHSAARCLQPCTLAAAAETTGRKRGEQGGSQLPRSA